MRRLAEICEVSRRTIYRDLAALAGAGITVLYRTDRQGYQLVQNVFLQPPKIEEREALALLVSCRQWGSGDDLGLSRHANHAIDKLIQALPDSMRTRLQAAAEILSDTPDGPATSPLRQAVDDCILVALTQRVQVRLQHSRGRDKDTGNDETGNLPAGEAPRLLVPGGKVNAALPRSAGSSPSDRTGGIDRRPIRDTPEIQPRAVPGQDGSRFLSAPLLEAARDRTFANPGLSG